MELDPQALHSDSGSLEATARRVDVESLILRQLDRISYLRSVGQPWREPVFMLRDLAVGLEDGEFWDGVPDIIRGKLNQEEVEAYGRRGWDSMQMREKELEDGRTVLDPTAAELSNALQIVMALFARRNMTWKVKKNHKIPLEFGNEED